MSPIPLGILAASGAGGGEAHQLIASVQLSSASASIVLSNIPSGYKYLELRGNTAGDNYPDLRFNGDSSNIYRYAVQRHNNESTAFTDNGLQIPVNPSGDQYNGYFKVRIGGYDNTNMLTSFVYESDIGDQSTYFIGQGFYDSTNQVTSMQLDYSSPAFPNNKAQVPSIVNLYGVL